MIYKMRFSGEGTDTKTGKQVSWKKGDIVEGEFEGLLPDTYTTAIIANTLAKATPPPRTTRRKSTR
jgi:hypothetical protein